MADFLSPFNFRPGAFVLAGLLFSLLPVRLSAQPARFRLPEELREVSGLAAVAPDSLWWHNDSGDAARLILTDGQGQLRAQVLLDGARHIDWEDMTHDPSGYLYLADFGDNLRQRSLLTIYRYHPQLQTLDSIRYAYPGGRRHDAEALCWRSDSLHIFTKDRLPKGSTTHHYALPARPGTHEAVWCDSLRLPKRVVTAAALSSDGRQLALLSYHFRLWLGFFPKSAASVFLFNLRPGYGLLADKPRRLPVSRIIATQYESADFLSPDTLLLASEQTLFIKAKARRLRLPQAAATPARIRGERGRRSP
jgi:hypothetical protein